MSKYFVFDKGLQESENWAHVRLPYSEAGPVKVLFILDRMPKEDLESGKLLSGLTGDILQSILQYAKKKYVPAQKWFSWAAVSWTAYRTYGRTDEFIAQAHQDFTTRVKALVQRYKPDFVVGFGTDVQDAFLQHKLTTDQKGNTRYSYWLGVPVPCEVSSHKFQFVSNLSLDIIARGSFTEAFMLGYMSRCLLPVFGKRYAVDGARLSAHKAYLLDSVSKVEKLLETMADKPVIAIDTETKNLNRITNKLLTIQYAYDQDKAFVIPIYHKDTPFSPKELTKVLQAQKEFFETRTEGVHVYANAKFDLLRIREEIGVEYYANDVVDIFAGDFCFHPDTLVLTELGLISIKSLVDSHTRPKVWSYNFASGKAELKEVLFGSEHVTDDDMYEIEYDGGSVRVTGKHEVWSVTRNAYVRAAEILPDEEVLVFPEQSF